MTVIAVIFGAAAGTGAVLAGERSRLQDLLDAEPTAEVRLLAGGAVPEVSGVACRIDLGSATTPPLDRVLRALGGRALYRRFAAFPLGRLINSLGPMDPGRVFWRSVRRSPAARALLTGVDVGLAADLAAVKTAWIAHRRGWLRQAFYDHRAAGLGETFRLPER
jgi:hypothetical protein